MIGFLKDQIADDVEEGGVSLSLSSYIVVVVVLFSLRYNIILMKNIIWDRIRMTFWIFNSIHSGNI